MTFAHRLCRHAFPALALLGTGSTLFAQTVDPSRRPIPSVLGSDVSYDASGRLVLTKNGETLADLGNTDKYTVSQMEGNAEGAETGIALDFKDPTLNGTIAYGTYQEQSARPAIWFLPKPVELRNGHALLELKKVYDRSNDIYHFTETGHGTIGFRVINSVGRILYEGRVRFSGKGPYQVLPTIVEGPLVNLPGPNGCVISFETQVPIATEITVNGKTFRDAAASTHHEIAVTGLAPDTLYNYTVRYAGQSESHPFRTAPEHGSRKPFTFAFVADNRSVTAGSETDLGSVNYLVTRAGMAAAAARQIAFMQVMGGNTTGNNTSISGHVLEHANFKRALEPYWSTIPVYTGMGNHEANYDFFAADRVSKKVTRLERFPYDTESGEVAFAQSFVNPKNGPESEDGASYDPNPQAQDFPSYKENVYFYTYGNMAMVVLNSEYWKSTDLKVSGNPEGYVMDQQLRWLEQTLQQMEADPKISHVFISVHSAMFPNGDHADAGMWYDGSNEARPVVAGKPIGNGIIERRDQLIDAAVNHSTKVIGFLSGGEHNFSLLKVTPGMEIYPEGYAKPKLKLRREFFFINNGGGGSYAYALMPKTPWADKFQYFTGPPTMALFHIDGLKVSMEVFNPQTFEKICNDISLR